VEAKASAGQGINSLFGIGKMIGDMLPVSADGRRAHRGHRASQDDRTINQSPMQPGVPYSAKPVGGK
jgi:hypothetical protein